MCGTTPTRPPSLCFPLTVDVFILSDQVRVSRMLPITVSSAIMGFELQNKARGPGAGLGVYVLGRPRGHGLGSDEKVESEEGLTGVACGETLPTGRVCHNQICVSQPNIQRHLPCIGPTLTCETFVLVSLGVTEQL